MIHRHLRIPGDVGGHRGSETFKEEMHSGRQVTFIDFLNQNLKNTQSLFLERFRSLGCHQSTKHCKKRNLLYTVSVRPSKQLETVLQTFANRDRCVFASSDLAGALPESEQPNVLLSRATKSGLLKRVCRGIYYYPHADYPVNDILYHTAARLRASEFLYLSLESVLSENGVISQIPFNWIGLMTSGRSNVIFCGDYGRIEFVHTAQSPDDVAGELSFDADRRLWVASVPQALRDMKATQRNLDLVNQEVADVTV